jgi:hypothetical protein
MKRKVILLGVAALLAGASPAQASVFGDELSKCLVQKTTEADKTVFIKWVFAAMSAHPEVESMSRLTPEQRKLLTRDAGQLMGRLMTVDCRSETVAAIKADGMSVLETSFGLLGEVAMRSFMTDPKVEAGMADLTTGLDAEALADVIREAGVKVPAKR